MRTTRARCRLTARAILRELEHPVLQSDAAPKGHNIRISANTWDPQLNAAHYASASVDRTFIGDYFGNTTAGSLDYVSSVSTYNDGTNPYYRQQQIVAVVSVP